MEKEAKGAFMAWEAWLDKVWRELVIEPVQNDVRTREGLPLGKTPAWIFNTAIGGGQADFDAPVADLLPADRALLYAYFNEKAHIDELNHAFRLLLPDVALLEGTTVLDIGCGPFTAGLALANVVGPNVAYRYFGFDRASSMRALGRHLANGVGKEGQLHARTEVQFGSDLRGASFGVRRAAERTLVVLSYLLASSSIDPVGLADDLVSASDRIGWGPVHVLYTNSAGAHNRRHYPVFQARMQHHGFHVEQEAMEDLPGRSSMRRIHYALFVRNGRTEVPVEEFLL